MSTREIALTTTPQLVASGAAYLQSRDFDFCFAFNSAQPTLTSVFHLDKKVYTDGGLGPIWAWKSTDSTVTLTVSEK